MKSILILDGLNCPNCAAKIEDKIRSDSRFADVEFNFINKKLSLSHEMDEEALIKEIDAIVSSIEDGVTVLDGDHEAHGHEHGHDHDHGHEHGHHHHGGEQSKTAVFLRAAAVAALVVLYFVFAKQPLFLAAAYIIAGGDVIFRAIRNIARGSLLDENFLMTAATVGAMVLGEYPEALAVMVFYQIGEFFQDMAVEKSKASIGKLLELKIESVNIVRDGGIYTADISEIKPDDILLIRQGEKLPVDGIITEGTAVLDTSALTGESLPREMAVGERVLSGCINSGEAIKIRAVTHYSDSTAAKIARMAENAAAHKAKAETFISAFARIYTPVVVGLALVIAILPCLILGFDKAWIYRGLVFLVASCPCALVLSVPLCFFSGIGRASRQGVLIKGGNYLQTLSGVKLVAFDKTGTLTTGEITAYSESAEALGIAAGLEQFSSHPIARAILRAYDGEIKKAEAVKEASGFGMTGTIDGREAAVGSKRFMETLGIDAVGADGDIFAAYDGKLVGGIYLLDELKPDSGTAVRSLEAAGIKTAMLTGDKKEKAENVCRELGISRAEAELLPADKLAAVERLKKEFGCTAFAGDGINDAPVLAGADIGIAMGGIGSDAAIEAADMVIMGDELSAVMRAVETSRYTMSVLKQNVVFIIAVKVLILVLAAAGISNMWLAVFADVGTALLSVLNSLRILRSA